MALPVEDSRDEIIDAVKTSRVVLVLGAAGCGKTTRVPFFVREALGGGRVLCTMARRIAATVCVVCTRFLQNSLPRTERG